MTMQSSGQITLSEIAAEFGGSAPHSLSEYYDAATGVPASGVISFSDFYGTSNYIPEATFYSSGTSTEAINDAISQINIQMVGGGGGGRKNGTVDGGAPSPSNGGTTTVVVKEAGGSTRTTFTAAGGVMGHWSGVGGSFSAGEDGDDFTHPGGGADSSFAGTGGAGGAYNTNNPGGTGGTGAGGGGMGQAGGGSAAHGGQGGEAGTFYTTTYTIVDVTDYLEITVGAGGSREGTARDGPGGGNGGGGRVRILGIV